MLSHMRKFLLLLLLVVGIWAFGLRFRPQSWGFGPWGPWGLGFGLQSWILFLRLGFGLWGWDLGLDAGIWASGLYLMLDAGF